MTEKQIVKFIKKRKIALLGSVGEDGFPTIKAVFKPRKIQGTVFYFASNTSSVRAEQWRNHEKACVYFYRKGIFSHTGVLLVGKMEVITDGSLKRELWHAGDKLVYRGGKSDPDYCILRFTAMRGRWYRDLNSGNFTISP